MFDLSTIDVASIGLVAIAFAFVEYAISKRRVRT